ncbi:MAG: hypothetical protein HY908_23035, partial [Myxococcales bacterium]|nr:hypothetical protein [Myxococcales bacterium]
DGEGAELAGRILPAGVLSELVAQAVAGATSTAAADGLAAGIALRAPADGDAEASRRTWAGLAKALATPAQGGPTGRARLAAWGGSGLGRHAATRLGRASSDERRAYARELAGALVEGALAADPRVLARGQRACPELVGLLCEAEVAVPPAVMELGWREPSIPDATLASLAARVTRPRQAPMEPADAELDLELAARPLALLEQVALAVGRTGPLSARVALAVIALDARRVRLVLAAVPRWRERLSGAELASVLRQHAGALVASRPEARPRGSEVKAWTERLLTDAEAAVALGLGHLTAEELAARLRSGRHKLADPAAVAAGVEARAAVEGALRVAPVVRWASEERARRSEALALWLLLEPVDGRRSAQALAGALDALAERSGAPPPLVGDALAILERRQPGRLETLMPQSPRGKATVATALGRAYRALGDR